MNNNIEKEFGPSSWAINNSTTMYVVMTLILILGISSYFNMPREDYPEIKENLVFVTHYVFIFEILNYAPSSGEIVITDKNLNIVDTLEIEY